jgi:hypothetical protein
MHIIMKNQADRHLISLESKLQLLAQGQAVGLTPEEAAIYGVEDADVYDPTLNRVAEDQFPDEPKFSNSVQFKF